MEAAAAAAVRGVSTEQRFAADVARFADIAASRGVVLIVEGVEIIPRRIWLHGATAARSASGLSLIHI